MILSDLVFEIPRKASPALSDKFNIVMICSFAPDEPVQQVVKAAYELEDVHFYITGNTKNAPNKLLEERTDNVTFTGFLSDQDYYDLLHASDAIMVLVDRANTMQQGAYEAVSVKKPMILSNSEVLQDTYQQGVVFVENNELGIREGVLKMINNFPKMKEEMDALHHERLAVWDEKCSFLKGVIK